MRIRYTRTELSEGIVETLEDVDFFVVLDDNTVELRRYTGEGNKYRVAGFIHPLRWESVLKVESARN